MKVYAIVDAGGEYYRGDGRWTPASNEACEYETRDEAETARVECGRTTARIVAWNAD